MESVGYLGPEGSYSYLACKNLRPDGEYKAYSSFNAVMRALLSDECDSIVLPIENSLNGGINQNIDLLQYTQGVYAFEECTVHIDHRLATLAGADLKNITRIYSHQQALEQCGEYLNENFPSTRLISAPSTAASLEMLKSNTDACIVGAHTLVEGVKLSEHNIADEKSNITHFLLIKKGEPNELARTQKIYFCATCTHKAGALYDLLGVIKDGNLNMTKIQSRPIKEKPGEYRFFVEVEGDYSCERVRAVLEKVKLSSNSFKLLGAY